MIEARTDMSIDKLKPSMKDLDKLDDAPLGEGIIAQVKADGERADVLSLGDEPLQGG